MHYFHLDRHKRFRWGILLMSISSLFAACMGLFVKIGTGDVPVLTLLFFRFVIPFILLVPLFIYKKTFLTFFLENQTPHILRGFFVILCQVCMFLYIKNHSLTNALMLWNSAPVFIPILGMLIYKDDIKRITWVSVLISLVGVIIVLKPGYSLFTFSSLLGLGAGFFMAVSQVIFGHSVTKMTVEKTVFGVYFYSAIFGFILDFSFSGHGNAIFTTQLDLILNHFGVLMMIALASIGVQLVRGNAYRYATPAGLSPMIYLSVFFAVILDLIIFKKLPSFLTIIGGLMIFLGSLIKWNAERKHVTKSE